MRYFSATIDKYFADWILQTTWCSGHASDEERFYRFVVSIHRFSKRVNTQPGKGKYIPCGANGERRRNGERNPRTYDEVAFKNKIVEAVTRNHSGFEGSYLKDAADRFTERAMDILDCLWATQEMPRTGRGMAKCECPLR